MHFSTPGVSTMPSLNSLRKRGGIDTLPLSSSLYSYSPSKLIPLYTTFIHFLPQISPFVKRLGLFFKIFFMVYGIMRLFVELPLFTVGILTASDKGWRGERQDKSAEAIRAGLSAVDCRVVKYEVVPDEHRIIADRLTSWADAGSVDVILTTGGTGLSQRDVIPEATLSVVERVVPGLVEAMRVQTLAKTPLAMLSRAVAGTRGRCLIINLPGSPKAVQECLEVILPAIPHAVDIITGKVTEHAASDSGKD